MRRPSAPSNASYAYLYENAAPRGGESIEFAARHVQFFVSIRESRLLVTVAIAFKWHLYYHGNIIYRGNLMASTDPTSLPLVHLSPVANSQNAWVSLTMRVLPIAGQPDAGLHSVFGTSDFLAAVAPLNCIVLLDNAEVLTETLLESMPTARVGFAIRSEALVDAAAGARALALSGHGYRVLLDGAPLAGNANMVALRAVATDFSLFPARRDVLPLMYGPHLAYGVHTAAQRAECARTGYEWFAGDYALRPAPSRNPDDGSSRKRLMALLGLLARDAETREIEHLLKQDPTLSYHLLKLANSAAFAHTMPITSFGQAISLLGRRQLQRWLQLLLYARQQPDALANPLLPIAALRASMMEALVKEAGGDREEQDLAFMTGVFSLLDLLLAMPMDEIVGALQLPPLASEALLAHTGRFGTLLALAESTCVTPGMLDGAELSTNAWWLIQLHAYHWAIQVSRSL